MLLAKINPPAKSVKQDTPFSALVEVVGDHMRVVADKYELGSNKVRFQVSFGFLLPNGTDEFIYQTIHRDTIVLQGAELTDWGTDDSVIFSKIAVKLSLTVVEMVEKNVKNDI